MVISQTKDNQDLWTQELLNFLLVANIPWDNCPIGFLLLCDIINRHGVGSSRGKIHFDMIKDFVSLHFTKGFQFKSNWEVGVACNADLSTTELDNLRSVGFSVFLSSLGSVVAHCMRGCRMRMDGRLGRDALVRCVGVGVRASAISMMIEQLLTDRDTLTLPADAAGVIDVVTMKGYLLACVNSLHGRQAMPLNEPDADPAASSGDSTAVIRSHVEKIRQLVRCLLVTAEFREASVDVLLEAALSAVTQWRVSPGVARRDAEWGSINNPVNSHDTMLSRLQRVTGSFVASVYECVVDTFGRREIQIGAASCVQLVLPSCDFYPHVRKLVLTDSSEYYEDTSQLLSHEFWRSERCEILGDLLHAYIVTKVTVCGGHISDTMNQVFDAYAIRLSMFLNLVSSFSWMQSPAVDASGVQNWHMNERCDRLTRDSFESLTIRQKLFRSKLDKIVSNISSDEVKLHSTLRVCSRLWTLVVSISRGLAADSSGFAADFIDLSSGCSLTLELFRIVACACDLAHDWMNRSSSRDPTQVLLFA
jgi:hypothetical protein